MLLARKVLKLDVNGVHMDNPVLLRATCVIKLTAHVRQGFTRKVILVRTVLLAKQVLKEQLRFRIVTKLKAPVLTVISDTMEYVHHVQKVKPVLNRQ